MMREREGERERKRERESKESFLSTLFNDNDDDIVKLQRENKGGY